MSDHTYHYEIFLELIFHTYNHTLIYISMENIVTGIDALIDVT